MATQIFTHDNVNFMDSYFPKTKKRIIRPVKFTDQVVENSYYAIKRENTKYLYGWDIFSANGSVIQTVWISLGTTNYDEERIIANHINNLNNKTNKGN